MTYVLGKPVRTGRYIVSVVSRQDTGSHKLSTKGIALTYLKEPVFIVVQCGQHRQAIDMTGASVSLAEIAELCPAVCKL